MGIRIVNYGDRLYVKLISVKRMTTEEIVLAVSALSSTDEHYVRQGLADLEKIKMCADFPSEECMENLVGVLSKWPTDEMTANVLAFIYRNHRRLRLPVLNTGFPEALVRAVAAHWNGILNVKCAIKFCVLLANTGSTSPLITKEFDYPTLFKLLEHESPHAREFAVLTLLRKDKRFFADQSGTSKAFQVLLELFLSDSFDDDGFLVAVVIIAVRLARHVSLPTDDQLAKRVAEKFKAFCKSHERKGLILCFEAVLICASDSGFPECFRLIVDNIRLLGNAADHCFKAKQANSLWASVLRLSQRVEQLKESLLPNTFSLFVKEARRVLLRSILWMGGPQIIEIPTWNLFSLLFKGKKIVFDIRLRRTILNALRNSKEKSHFHGVIMACENVLELARMGIMDYFVGEERIENLPEYTLDEIPNECLKMTSLQTLIARLQNLNFRYEDFVSSGLVSKCLEFLDSDSKQREEDLVWLWNLLMCVMCTVGNDVPFIGEDSAQATISCTLSGLSDILDYGAKNILVSTTATCDVLENNLSGWSDDLDSCMHAYEGNPSIHQYLEPPSEFRDMNRSVYGLLCNDGSYIPFRIVYNGCTFRRNFSIPIQLARTLKCIQDLETKHTLELYLEDDVPSPLNNRIVFPREHFDTHAKLETILRLTDKLSTMFHGDCPHHEEFSTWMDYQLSFVMPTAGFFNLASYLFLKHSYLLTPSQRLLVARLCFTNPLHSFNWVSWRAGVERLKECLTKKTVGVTVRRDFLFDDGKFIITNLAESSCDIDVRFVGEEGKGTGPTREFFMLMGNEFMKSSRKMWRNDAFSEYVWSRQGLFPSVFADPSDFYLCGLFCAKAVVMNQTLEMPFSRAFFKLIKGEKVTMAEIDDQYASAFSNPEYLVGFTFVYPGSDLELVEGGTEKEVTQENALEYVAKVEEFTFGERLIKNTIEPFRKGWEKVNDLDFFDGLLVDDLCEIFSGLRGKLTKSDLFENVSFEPNFNHVEAVIDNFCSVVSEFTLNQQKQFLRFATGVGHLPPGGLGGLRPKLSVVHPFCDDSAAEDGRLPLAITCQNIIKLPEYSNREIMRKKLLTAISWAETGFAFV